MAAYTTIDNPELYFQTKLYTGTGSSQAITLDGDENMQPDFIWFKNRTSAQAHCLVDAVRGRKGIMSDSTSAEMTFDATKDFTSFDSDGFTVGIPHQVNSLNYNTGSIVSWNWKAGTSWSNDASATGVGSLDSSGSKSSISGFSIISFTGTESGTPSIAHGLSSTPEFIISKSRDVADNWMVFHGSFSAQDYMILNTSAAKASASSVWNSLPSSTVINMGDNAGVNDDGAMIMYAWNSVQGFSKFGTYTGNANADGPMIFLGFRPAFVLFKRTSGSAANWQLWDNKRNPTNAVNRSLLPDDSAAEQTDQNIDFLAQGFKIRSSAAHLNADGVTFIYAAFAEAPFVNSKGVPCNAR